MGLVWNTRRTRDPSLPGSDKKWYQSHLDCRSQPSRMAVSWKVQNLFYITRKIICSLLILVINLPLVLLAILSFLILSSPFYNVKWILFPLKFSIDGPTVLALVFKTSRLEAVKGASSCKFHRRPWVSSRMLCKASEVFRKAFELVVFVWVGCSLFPP